MRFVFNEKKAAQTAAYLLQRCGGEMKYLKLIKILYLADRESLLKTGHPITGDRHVSMDNGPVLSRVLNLIREEPSEANSPWYDYISTPESWSVGLKDKDPNFDELSRYEMAILDGLLEKYKNMDAFVLADLTHEICPEWNDPQGSVLPINPEDILRAEGKSEADIEQIGKEAQDLAFILHAVKAV